MIATLRKLHDLLSPRERRQAVLVFAMMLVAAFLEVAGVASVMPFIAVLADTSIIQTNQVLLWLYTTLAFTSTQSFLIFLGSVLLVIFLGSLGFRALTLYAIQRYSSMRLHSLAARLLSVYLHQPYEFFLENNSATLSKKILSEVANVANGVLLPSMRALSGIIIASALIILMVAVNPITSIALAAGLTLTYASVYLATRSLFDRAGKSFVDANTTRYVVASEALQGFKELAVLDRVAAYLKRFDAPSREFAHRYAQSLIVRELPYFFVQGIAFGGILALLLVLVARGESLNAILPLVTFYAFAGYRMLPAFQDIYRSLGQIKFYLPALHELYVDMTRPVTQIGEGRIQPASPLAGSIAFKKVSFNYRSADRLALEDITFEIPQGHSVAFVGRTGSGKSTIVDLMLGLLRPTRGEIQMNGVALSDQNMRSWQANLGYVPQSIFLTDDTIAANIAFGIPRNQIEMQAVQEAAQQAQIHDFIVTELPDGYQTPVGERGARLSGGQVQRIGIARALYRDPSVVIFDEATSALDNTTEAAVMDAVRKLKGQKTIVMVAHRLSTVEDCDKIFELNEGRLIAPSKQAAENPTPTEPAT